MFLLLLCFFCFVFRYKLCLTKVSTVKYDTRKFKVSWVQSSIKKAVSLKRVSIVNCIACYIIYDK